MKLFNKSIRGIFFDLDGVLLDSMTAHARAWQMAFDELSIHFETDIFLENEGSLMGDILAGMPQADGRFRADDFMSVLGRQREIFMDGFADGITCYPGTTDLLEALRDMDLELAMVTSSSRNILIPEVESLIDRYFTCLVTGDQCTRHKPHPEPYLTALKGTGLSPEAALVVENAPAGIRAAKSAGITCLALTTTLPPDKLSLADRVFTGHDELAQWFKGLAG